MAEGQQQCMYVYVCVCVYNKTQIQMAFYATRFGMHGRRVRGRGGAIATCKPCISLCTTNSLTRAANNGYTDMQSRTCCSCK